MQRERECSVGGRGFWDKGGFIYNQAKQKTSISQQLNEQRSSHPCRAHTNIHVEHTNIHANIIEVVGEIWLPIKSPSPNPGPLHPHLSGPIFRNVHRCHNLHSQWLQLPPPASSSVLHLLVSTLERKGRKMPLKERHM